MKLASMRGRLPNRFDMLALGMAKVTPTMPGIAATRPTVPVEAEDAAAASGTSTNAAL
jgi:hypothetical protein